MTDIVEIANQGHINAHAVKRVADMGYGGRRFRPIDRDADEFGAGACEFGDLSCGCSNVGCIGVGHRLDDDWRTATDRNATNQHGDALASFTDCRIWHAIP
jgi:hypothetical protein